MHETTWDDAGTSREVHAWNCRLMWRGVAKGKEDGVAANLIEGGRCGLHLREEVRARALHEPAVPVEVCWGVVRGKQAVVIWCGGHGILGCYS